MNRAGGGIMHSGIMGGGGGGYRDQREFLKNDWGNTAIAVSGSTYIDETVNLDIGTVRKALETLKQKNIKKNNKITMESDKKFYKVIKETPAWDVGAILREDGADGYVAVNTLFNRDGVETGHWEAKKLVEKQGAYFEQVYQVMDGKKTVYVTKEKARELFTAAVTA